MTVIHGAGNVPLESGYHGLFLKLTCSVKLIDRVEHYYVKQGWRRGSNLNRTVPGRFCLKMKNMGPFSVSVMDFHSKLCY